MAYRHLDTDRQEIRLVTLEPGEGSADIQCRLSVVSLFDEIAYEALSYVWGDDTITTMIYLDESPFNATVNLAVALQHLRKADQPRVIWIDALSINQKNITERNSQVNIMGNIYRNAVEVIAWLGLAGDDDYPAFDLFLTISGESQRTINGKHWGPADHPHSTSLSLKTKDLKAIRSLVARPWWRRMWTVQELLLAKKVTFHCGTRQLSVEAMFATSDSYFAHVQNCCEKYFRSAFDESLMVGFNESMSTIDRLGVFRKSNISLQNALMFFRHRQCQDPRDMIYGLVGLASDVSKEEILPDYESPISKVYTDTTILLIRKSQSLRTFSQLFHHPQSQSSLSASKSALELPSWVPDWSTKWSDEYISAMMIRLGFQIQHLRAGGNARDSFFNRSSNGAAICRGLIVGRVDALSEARPADSDKFDVQTLRSWQVSMKLDQNGGIRYPSWSTDQIYSRQQKSLRKFETWLDAFYRTICSSVIPNRPSQQADNATGTSRAKFETRYMFNAVSWLLL